LPLLFRSVDPQFLQGRIELELLMPHVLQT